MIKHFLQFLPKRQGRIAAILFFYFLPLSAVWAQDLPKNLKECYELALKQSETLAIQEAVLDEAAGRFQQALSGILPRIGFNYANEWQDGDDREGTPTARFTASQPLFTGFKEFAAIAAGKAEKRQRDHEYERAKQILFRDVADAYYLLLNYQEDVETLHTIKTTLNERIEEQKTALTITRQDRERAIRLYANVAQGKSQADALEAVKRLTKEVLPDGYHAVFSGSTQTFQESFGSLNFVLWLGIIVAYMVLASQFNSYIDPLTILLALPFSVSGALMGLWVMNQSLNIYSFIGIILLMGIVKKNSILLVDFTNQLRAQGRPVRDALLEACPTRLRPILMTSMATIAAAIPPAFSLGPGSEVLRPMATAVIGGVAVSTVFTVVAVPCVYLLFARLRAKGPK